MKVSAHQLFRFCCSASSWSPLACRAEQVSREQDIVDLRLGQRIMVDDGSCPAGQIKEVSGAKMTADGIVPYAKMHSAAGTEEE